MRLRIFLRTSLLALAALALAACGGGSDQTVDPGSTTTLEGAVFKGVTRNAVVTAWGFNDDGELVELASGTSSANGGFSLTLPAGYRGVIRIVATASQPPAAPTEMRCDAPSGCAVHDNDGNLVDTADFGEWFPVAADFSLRAVATVTLNGIQMVNLTPLSTLAADWAALYPQGLDAQSVLDANTRIAAAFGLQLADLNLPLHDVTDPLFAGIADSKTLRLSLLMAAFAEVAAQNHVSAEDFVQTAAAFFTGQGGALRQAGDGVGPSLYDLFTGMQTVAGYIDMPNTPATADLEASLLASLAALQAGALSHISEISLDDLLAQLGPLGADIDELLGLTGLDDPTAFVIAQLPKFEWLLAPENVQLLPLAIETVASALLASYYLDLPILETMPGYPQVTFGEGLTLDAETQTLFLSGYNYGQQYEFEIGLTALSAGVAAGQFDYSVAGAISNDVASGTIEGELSLDTRDTNLAPLLGAMSALLTGMGNQETVFAALRAAALDLVQNANVEVTLSGNAELVRNSDPGQVLGGAVDLTGTLDMGAGPGEDIATLLVRSAELRLPNGDHFYGLPDTPVLVINVNDNATLELAGAATVLGLPEAVAGAEGTLVNSRALFEHIQDNLVAVLSADTFDLGATIDAFLDFDLSQLAIQGHGVIDIAELGHQYRATLNNTTVTVYQPYSDTVALTASLDLHAQAVVMDIGGERWALRALTSPTPRLVLVGESGQFLELSDADMMAFLGTLPLGDLLAGMGLP